MVRFGSLISTQRWKGTRARDVLTAAGVQAGATHVLWRAVDGYTESIPLDVAMDERTWLAYEMGPPGTALTADHLRMVCGHRCLAWHLAGCGSQVCVTHMLSIRIKYGKFDRIYAMRGSMSGHILNKGGMTNLVGYVGPYGETDQSRRA